MANNLILDYLHINLYIICRYFFTNLRLCDLKKGVPYGEKYTERTYHRGGPKETKRRQKHTDEGETAIAVFNHI